MTLGNRAAELGAFLIVLIIVVRLASPVVGVAINESRTSYDDTVEIAGGSGELNAYIGIKDLTVDQSLNNTVKFTGASDSELTGSANITHDTTWTVSTWARLDSTVNTTTAQMRVLRLGGFLYLSYNKTEWRAVYYDDTTLNSYAINVSAPSPTTWTHLTVQSNSTHLQLVRNNSTRSVLELTDGNSFDGNYITSNLHGRVEDTRVLDDNVTVGERGQLYQNKTAPLKANETARIYYDRYPGETSVDVFRTGTDLSASNTTTVDGFSGEPTDGDDWNRQVGTLIATDGGTLDGAPAAFASYSAVGVFGTIIGDVLSLGGAALGLLVVGSLLLAYQGIKPFITDF